jgi:replicative DNA helicase
MARKPIDTDDEKTRVEPVVVNHNTTNEQIIIAAALADEWTRKRLVRRFGNPEAFGAKIHSKLWGAIIAMDAERLEFDPATIQSLVDTDTAEYAQELVDARPSVPPNLDHHIEMLDWDMRRLKVAQTSLAELIHNIKNPSAGQDTIATLARSIAEDLCHGEGRLRIDSEAVLTKQFADIDARCKGIAIYPYGLDGFDRYEDDEPRIMPGMAPKQATLITGVSGSGKSSVTARIILEQIRMGRKVVYGAWEMNPGITLELLAVLKLQLSRTKFIAGLYSPAEIVNVKVAMRELTKQITFIDVPSVVIRRKRETRSSIRPNNAQSINLLCDELDELSPDVFVGDLVRKSFMSLDPEQEELALNLFQRRIENSNYHAVFVQQQRLKDIEMRPDKRPTREGVKGSSTWVEMVDTALGVHREALWKDVDDNILEIDILKQRYGKWPLAVQFDWNPVFSTLKLGRTVDYSIGLGEENGVGASGVDTILGRKGRKYGRRG